MQSAASVLRGGARPPPEAIAAFIDAHRDRETGGRRWGVEPICTQLQVAPSIYYDAESRPPSSRAVRDAEMGPKLEALWKQNYSVYGRRKLTTAARRTGLDIGRDQTARLMRAQGIRGASRAKKRFTTHSDPAHTRAPDLVNRNFTAPRPDALSVADFTYCSTWSDIVGTIGDSYDNAMAESVMGIIKTELFRNPAARVDNGGPWKGLDDLEIATCALVCWFNEERLHRELDDHTPAEFEADYRRHSQPNAA